MRTNRKLNCSYTAAEKQTIKQRLTEWCERFFEEENIFPNLDFASWNLDLYELSDGLTARLGILIDRDTSHFPEITKNAKIVTGESSEIATAAKDMVENALSDLIFELEDLIEKQLEYRIDDGFSCDSIDVRVHTPGNNGSEWSADVEINGLESAKTTEPEYFDAELEFTLVPQSIMTAISDCADYIKYQY